MSLNKIREELKKVKIPIAYYQFARGASPGFPYIIYYDKANNERGADLKPCISESDIVIELYSGKIDCSIERQIKECLKNLGISFEFNREWIEKENMWETLFEFHIINKEAIK